MADQVRLEVVTPNREVASITTDEVVQLPGGDGLFGVLPGHSGLMTTLTPGVVSWMIDPDNDAGLVVGGGFAVVQDNVVTVLAESAELPGEIDVDAAQKALAEAEGELPTATSLEEESAVRERIALQNSRVEARARWE